MRRTGLHRPARSREGYVLIAVLWLTVFLCALGLELAVQSRNARLVALALLDDVRLRAGLDGCLAYARARLHRAALNRTRWDTFPEREFGDGTGGTGSSWEPESRSVGVVRASIHVRDAASTLDLNGIDEEGFARFLAGFGLSAEAAAGLAARVADWRDRDRQPRPGGAEREDYLAAGHPAIPRDGTFAAVDELADVMGMPFDLLARIRPSLAVGGPSRVNVNSAPRAVLLSLPGFSAEVVEAVEQQRRQGRRLRDLDDVSARVSYEARRELADARPALQRLSTFSSTQLELRCTARLPSGQRREMSAITSLDGSLIQPARVELP